jgi:crotonobetainyl-CoA:carnitine CoA-transferase CaiB-like acyl-CoA transferase
LRFESIDCCFAPILDLREALESEHIESRELIQRGTDGRRQVLFPVKVNGKPPSLRMPVRDADETQDDTSTDSRTTRASGH